MNESMTSETATRSPKMRRVLSVAGVAAVALLWAQQAQASSCSLFATITAYDEASSSITIEEGDGKTSQFFPRPEGAPDTTKVPKKCSKRVLKADSFPVKPTGGRLSVTQIRSNFEGKMLNKTDDPAWLPGELRKIVEAQSTVLVVLRPPPGKKEPYGVTTVYLPVTEEELAEIARIERDVSDAD